MQDTIRPKTQKSRNRKRAYMKRIRKRKLTIRIVTFIILIASVIGGAFLIKKFGPSKEKANLEKYYGIEKENQLAIIIDNEVVGAQGILIEGNPYVEYSIVRDYLNERFYLDVYENILLYTLPQGTIRVNVGSNEYTLQKEKNSVDYAILKMEGSTAYIALDFVQQYTNIDFKMYDNPNRVVITNGSGQITVATVKKDTQVRTQNNVKAPILTNVSKKDIVTIVEAEGSWRKICTEDGVVGYVQSNRLKKEAVKTINQDFKEQKYENISKNYTINMAWHMVTNRTANNDVLETISNTKDLTTISPTWFTIADTQGNLTSLASEKYVNDAHWVGIEVWALVKDFDGGINSDEQTYELLSHTTSRENLINQLIAETLKYNIDGINVDFEKVSKECAEHYMQFLRELSLMCRKNEIVLSVDNRVPSQYSTHYNLEEQGKIVDYVIIMGYDEHYNGSYESGPVASYDFVKKGIEDALRMVPSNKLINAVPFYTRLWEEVEKTAEELEAEAGTDAAEYPMKVTSKAYGMDTIQGVIADAKAKITLDEKTDQNYAQWTAGDVTYKVWLEDELSMEARLKLMKEHKLAGVAAWRLGFENSEIWELIQKYVN